MSAKATTAEAIFIGHPFTPRDPPGRQGIMPPAEPLVLPERGCGPESSRLHHIAVCFADHRWPAQHGSM